MKNDYEFLVWIYDRLIYVHRENKNYDFMLRFKRFLEENKDFMVKPNEK